MQMNDKIELHHTIAAGDDASTLAAFAHYRSQRYDIMKTCHVSTNRICDMWLPCFPCTLQRERERVRERARERKRGERREEARLDTCVPLYLHMHLTSGSCGMQFLAFAYGVRITSRALLPLLAVPFYTAPKPGQKIWRWSRPEHERSMDCLRE